MADDEFRALAKSIPTMVKDDTFAFLEGVARTVPEGSAIVEVGAWLGGTTAHMALGAREADPQPEIHVFDRFTATKAEVEKAAKAGVTLELREDTRPFVKPVLDRFGTPIHLRRGDIMDIEWDGTPIGLYVDDAAKMPKHFQHVVRTFAPSWIPGATIVALLDYKHWEKFEDPEKRRPFSVQKEFIESYPDHFEKVMESRVSSVCAFRYLKPLDFGALPFGRMEAERGPPQGLRAALSQTLQNAFGIGR